MAPDSMLPTSGGSNTKYIIAALILLGGAAGAWFFLKASTEKAAPPIKAQAEEPARSTALAQDQELEIPEELPEEEEEAPKKTVRRVAQTWDCTGAVDRSKAAQLMRENGRIVRACYERQLRTDSLLQGTAELTLRINASGAVTGTKISGTLRDNAFRACVKNAADRWKFPPPTGGSCALIAQPFDLTPKTQ
ncbi:MAG: AgmX/PglI C-terminal domain-containing protein [Myxococcales bacterium]|nr:MAG: AgmX/PglI C-terminal domain-containing protein [Myxococcales bacterium]